jgi:exonuclease III
MNIGTWNVTSLTGKELELIEEAKKYQLDILGISSTKRKGKGTLNLNNGWQLFYSGVDPTIHAQAGVAILLHPRLTDAVVEWQPINERVTLLRLKLKKTTLTVIQVYAPNLEADYAAFLDTVLSAMESVPMTDSITIIGDFNAHVGNDSQT